MTTLVTLGAVLVIVSLLEKRGPLAQRLHREVWDEGKAVDDESLLPCQPSLWERPGAGGDTGPGLGELSI